MSDSLPYNPMSHEHIDVLNAKRNLTVEQKAKLEEEIVEYKAALNGLASTPNGQLFLKKLIRFSGAFSFDNDPNPVKMYEEKGKRKAYLELVRPYLEPQIRSELEI